MAVETQTRPRHESETGRVPGGARPNGAPERGHAGHNGEPALRGRSFMGLLGDLRDESMTLVQDEIHLAKSELQEKVSEAMQGAVATATGAAVLGAGTLVILFAAAAGLYAAMLVAEIDPLIAGWVAPLIVGGITAIAGWAMLAGGKRKMDSSNLRPTRTERSLRETGQWAERKV